MTESECKSSPHPFVAAVRRVPVHPIHTSASVLHTSCYLAGGTRTHARTRQVAPRKAVFYNELRRSFSYKYYSDRHTTESSSMQSSPTPMDLATIGIVRSRCHARLSLKSRTFVAKVVLRLQLATSGYRFVFGVLAAITDGPHFFSLIRRACGSLDTSRALIVGMD